MKGKFKSRRLLLALLLPGLPWLILWLVYGGGTEYPNLNTPPLLPASQLEKVAEYELPFGKIAVSREGRIFCTIHPEAEPDNLKLIEWRDGQAHAFPSQDWQTDSLKSPLGIAIDGQNRLWVLDHGKQGFSVPQVWAFELTSGEQVYHHVFSSAIAPPGSYLNDLTVSKDGRYILITDLSILRKDPAFVVHDTETKQSRRRLSGHPSVQSQSYLIRTPEKSMRYFGALSLMPGLSGLTTDFAGKKLYFGAMSHGELFSIPVSALCNLFLDEKKLQAQIESCGPKPLSSALAADTGGSIYLSDVEHGAVMHWQQDKGLVTLIQDSSRLRWINGLSFGADGMLYICESAQQDVLFKSESQIRRAGPFCIYRVRVY